MAEEEVQSEPKLEISLTHENDNGSAVFILHDEDHTLGNALRYMCMKNPSVEMCGYTIPHPSENKVNLRIQTREAHGTAVKAFEKGLQDLSDLCDVLLDKVDNGKAKK